MRTEKILVLTGSEGKGESMTHFSAEMATELIGEVVRAKELSEAGQILTSELKWARKLFQGQAEGTARELRGKLGKRQCHRDQTSKP